jgi:DNA primase
LNTSIDIEEIKKIPVINVAMALGIEILPGNKAMCFFGHDNKTPSLSFNVKENYWHCFGCDRGGDNIKLVMDMKDIKFGQAIEWFDLSFSTIKVVSSRRRSKSSFTAIRSDSKKKINNNRKNYNSDPEIYEWIIENSSISERSYNYLNKRGVTVESLEAFCIRDLTDPLEFFTAMKNRWGLIRLTKCGLISFESKYSKPPWWDYSLWIPFFKGKRIEYLQRRRFASEGPKYVNLCGLKKPVYNINVLEKMKPFEKLFICEGVPDTILASQLGWNAIGILGLSALDDKILKILMPYSIHVIPDNDSAGFKLFNKIRGKFFERGKIIQRVNLNGAKDLNDLLEKFKIRK